MYQKHFGLTERPFSIAPDPRFLYMSQQHREALAHLLYGVGEGGGFVQLTGEVGTGKTTICRCLLEQLPEHVDVALILNPRVTAKELLASLCDELRIQYAKDTTSIKSLTDVLNAYLLDSHARGQRTVLMIDEAQNMSADALEQVRLLTNLETTREKLLQIILVGQPELRSLLAREDLRQLSQRITARYHLEPISRAETEAYMRHRLQVCGAGEQIFNDSAIDLIQKLSSGVPRLINVLCDRAMLGAFVEGKHRIDLPIVSKAAREVLPEEGLEAPGRRRWRYAAIGGVAATVAFIVYLLVFFEQNETVSPRAVNAPVVPVPQSQLPAEVAAIAQPTAAPVSVTEPPVAAAAAEVVKVTESETAVAGNPASLTLVQALAEAGTGAAADAWAGLFRLWGIQADVQTDEEACARAPAVGLRCLQGGGSWTALTHYDRPALLLLVAAKGRRVPVLLQAVIGSRVKLVVDGREMLVPVSELEQHWFGEYRLLWRTPPEGRAVLRPGDRGGDVVWLRERLQKATGMAAVVSDPSYFDPALKAMVETFQRERELNADGVVGARTLINLNNLERQPTVPRLGSARG